MLLLLSENTGSKSLSLKVLIFNFVSSGVNALPAMWKFFKTNWFAVALMLLLLVAIGRNNPRLRFWNTSSPAASTGKYTDAHPGATAHLDLFGGSGAPMVAMPTVDDATAVAFLKRFGHLAVNEQKKFGIPPSLLLACAYVNSHSGQRDAAQQANNYFALPCAGWQGAVATVDGQCMRRYDTAWASFRDFGGFVSSQPWYDALRQSAGTDWQSWLKALDGKGISDVRNHVGEMQSVIETYRLYELDAKGSK